MSQSNVIAGSIFAAFVLFVTAKGELPTYLGFFGVGKNKGASATSSDPITSAVNAANNAGKAVNQFVTAAPGSGFVGLGTSIQGTENAIGAIGGFGGN